MLIPVDPTGAEAAVSSSSLCLLDWGWIFSKLELVGDEFMVVVSSFFLNPEVVLYVP